MDGLDVGVVVGVADEPLPVDVAVKLRELEAARDSPLAEDVRCDIVPVLFL